MSAWRQREQDPPRAAHWFPEGAALFTGPPSPPAAGRIKDDADTIIWPHELGNGRRAIVKMYRRRDAYAFVRGRLFRSRVRREFEALARLFAHAVPCSEPIAWAHGRSSEHGRYEILATVEIPAARSAMELVTKTECDVERLDLRPLFRSVWRMHEGGVFHGALKLHNVLATSERGGAHAFSIIDTPRALLYPQSIVGTRMARFDLLRLSSDVARILGWSGERIPLEEYGLDEAARRAFLARMSSFRATKLARTRIRAHALLSQAGARLGIHAGRGASATAHA